MIIKRKDYPFSLERMDEVPEYLYYQGKRNLLYRKTVTIVGTRRPSAYGISVTRKIVEKLVARDIVVVSGFAKGIDETAHRAAFEYGGTSIAVLGTGLRSLYPRGRDLLRWRMEEEGLLLTEYPPDVEARPYHFPRRNRLLAALSPLVLVVECSIASGTMTTAKEAIKQAKDLWVVPGRIGDEYALGPNYLLFQGANPLYHVDLIDQWEDELWQRIW